MANRKKPQKVLVAIEGTHKINEQAIVDQIAKLRSKLHSSPGLQIVIDKWELRLEQLNLDRIRQKQREERRAVKLARYMEDVSTYKTPTDD